MPNKELTLKWKKEHPDKVKEHNRKGAAIFYKRNPNRQKHNALKRKYGISYEDYLAMVLARKGLCEICGIEKKLYVDHCHKTSKIRGLLCLNCNAGIGNLRDSISLLEKALNYLQKHAI